MCKCKYCPPEGRCQVLYAMKNFRVIFASRPGEDNAPTVSNFIYEECQMPCESLERGEVLIRTCYLSVDPAQRCQMNADTGVEYFSSWPIGEEIKGLLGVGVIERSNHPVFEVNDWISGSMAWPWKNYFVQKVENEENFQKVDKASLQGNMPILLSLLGLVGLTAFLGIREKAGIKPNAGQTLVVSGAAGACGSLAGQIARLMGCSRIVGICGSRGKCEWLVGELGFDAAVDYKTEDVADRLRVHCPDGIDAYFDNVGGGLSELVVEQMKPNSRVVLCGQISVYNKKLPYPPPVSATMQRHLQEKQITRERFLVLSYKEKFQAALSQLAVWHAQGDIKVGETVTEGLENAGMAFVSMMKGGNIGKQIVKVSSP